MSRQGQPLRSAKHILGFTLLLGLAACAQPEEEEIVETSSFCSAAKVKTEYLVQWKNGKITVEHADSEEDFFDNVVLENEDLIEHTEHNFRIALPSPPQLSKNEKLSSSASLLNWGVDRIEASSVWPTANGTGVTVAVIDSGVDLTHIQLQDQLYVNTAELNGTAGVDDDGNGFVDDIHGYDFVSDTGSVTDVLIGNSHGTHVAGVIAAKHIGDANVKGVAPGAKIMALNFMDSSSGGTIGDAIRAINYAVENGAQIINASWGSNACSSILEDRVAKLADDGVLFVAAAGNAGSDIGIFPEFPASYDFAHQITVGASTETDFRASFSNFSGSYVHLLAPGVNIISTVPADDPKSNKRGTSMATPFVAGAAAVLLSASPGATPNQLRSAILDSVDKNENIGNGDVITQGRLNLRKAFNLLTGNNL